METNAAPISHDKPGEIKQPAFKRNRTEGHVISVDGQTAVISAHTGDGSGASQDYWTVGQQISVIVSDTNRIVGLIFKVDAPKKDWSKDGDNQVNVHIELVGEVIQREDGTVKFNSGISNYPYVGAIAHRIRSADLASIYENSEESSIPIGNITQDASIPALITVDKLLSRHFAVVGTTGVGKSTSVTLLLRKIVKVRPEIRVLILDPHNEFSSAFPREAITVDASSLEMPFWMFKLEEFIEVIYRGRPPIGEEVDALRDLIPDAKAMYDEGPKSANSSLQKKKTNIHKGYTADTPVPYRMADLFKLIDDKLGLLEGKQERPHLKALMGRLQSLMEDARFRFMFESKGTGDAMQQMLSYVFRIPQNDKPICVFELSGLPSEVVNVVASVMCRLAFDLGISSGGKIQTLVVCEEAHRYIPEDRTAGFWPTRAAIARIAKEGRKYGVYLGVITQRPGELDATILSQCNTVFSMRLGNQRDQDIIKQAISGAASSTISFLSSLANRECIAFGEAIDSPMRMMFETVPKEDLPGSHIYENQAQVRSGNYVPSVSSVIRHMRNQGTNVSDGLGGNNENEVIADRQIVGEQVGSSAQNPAHAQQDALRASLNNNINSVQQPTSNISNDQQTGRFTSIGQSAQHTPVMPAAAPSHNQANAPINPTPTKGTGSLIRSFRSK